MFDISNNSTILTGWKRFEANRLTHSAAHHLCAIHELGGKAGGWARVTDIAANLGVTRGTVSINLRTLKARGLVVADDRRMVRLSSHGHAMVHEVRAKKAILKSFLTGVLGLNERLADVDRCKIEHLLSQRTSLRLARWLKQFHPGQPV